MTKYNYSGLRESVEMWRRVNDSIRNCSFHISNARLFVLDEMITARIESNLHDEDKFHPVMMHITMLIDEAKKATASAKVIYLFIIDDWLQRIIRMIDEGLKEEVTFLRPFDLVRDWSTSANWLSSTLVTEKVTPPDSEYPDPEDGDWNEPYRDLASGDIPL